MAADSKQAGGKNSTFGGKGATSPEKTGFQSVSDRELLYMSGFPIHDNLLA